MTRQETLDRLSAQQSEFARFGVRSLAVFGSAARDEAGLTSDVDVLVEFDGPGTFDRYVDLILFLKGLLGCPVDVVTRRSLRPGIRQQIEREAIYVSGCR